MRNFSRTPLALAVVLGRIEAVTILLDHGAKVNPEAEMASKTSRATSRGFTPLCLAIKHHHVDIMRR